MKLFSLNHYCNQDPTPYYSNIILEMFHSEQAAVSVIFLNGLSSDLLGNVSLIKLNADMPSPLGGIVSSAVMKGSGGV